jgi:penicillin-binding protein 1A
MPERDKLNKITYYAKRSVFLLIFLLPFTFPFYLLLSYFKVFKRNFLAFLLLHIVSFCGIFFYLKIVIFDKLPKIEKIIDYKPSLSTKFYDSQGDIIFELGVQKRSFTPIERIPQKLIQAFIAAEDKTFYTNNGIDLYGIFRMAVTNLYKILKKERLEGASTITQQVVRNILLTNERTITRKLKELILSYQLTKAVRKDKIMEIYLNHIYLGMKSYGVTTASESYFNKNLEHLTLPEMATLAALPKAPSAINPFKNKIRTTSRRNWILKRMLEDRYISEDEYHLAISQDLVVKSVKDTNYSPFYAPVFFAKSNIIKSSIIDEDSLVNNGYSIKLTIDKQMQQIAQNSLNRGLIDYTKKAGFYGPLYQFQESSLSDNNWHKLLLSVDEIDEIGDLTLAIVLKVSKDKVEVGLQDNTVSYIDLNDMLWARRRLASGEIGPEIKKCSDILSVGDIIAVKKVQDKVTLEQIPKINGSLVAIDSKTGKILAMVGGYLDIAGSFNRATQAIRQLGSTVKPFIYAAALESNITPADIFMDSDISFNIGSGVVWKPRNHTRTTDGPVTFRMGLEKSLNTVTVRISDRIGVSKIRNYLIDFGINKDPEANLSVAVGSIESSLLAVVRGYSCFVNQGVMLDPYIVEEIKSNDSAFEKILLTGIDFNPVVHNSITDSTVAENEKKPIISSDSAYQVLSILEGAVKRGTAHQLSSLDFPVAAKSGTSDKGKDLWTIAITADVIVGVYVGYDNNLPTEKYGSQVSLPIVKEFLSLMKHSNSNFKMPEKPLQYVKIDRLTGKRTNRPLSNEVIYELFKISDQLPKFESELGEEKIYDITDLEKE